MYIYSIKDNPGDYKDILNEPFDVLISNNNDYDSDIEIIIPTFQRSSLLRKSLMSALNQLTDEKYLITIIDNDPNTAATSLEDLMLYKDRLRYIRNRKNLGALASWNRALQVSKAPFIALLHDDDMLEPDYIASVKKVLSLYSEIGVITHTPYNLIDDEKIDPFYKFMMKIRRGIIFELSWKNYLFGNVTNASAMIINKEKGINIGGWKVSEEPSGDWFFNARMAYNHKVLKYYMPLSTYRWEVNASLQKDVQENINKGDAYFILNNLNTGLPISKMTKLIAEISAFQLIKSMGNDVISSVPYFQTTVQKFNWINPYILLILKIYKKLYIKLYFFINLNPFKRVN
jgi:glycosyltransferase involved in cell wall biosynthesis